MTRWLLALALLAGAARAQPIDMSRGGPVEVTASQGMEWRQNEQMVVARGDARAVRGEVTVLADTLIARYRRKGGADAPPPPPGTQPGAVDTGNNEIYRLEAEGRVHIYTPTDQAWADRAVYDIDKAVLVLTGKDLKITTPQQLMTARDAMEYWTQQHMAVGRGAATVTTADNRRLTADTVVGYTADATPAPGAPGGARKPPVQPAAAKAGGEAASGKLQKVEAYGNVEVRTPTETIRADRGVYVPDTQIARLVGHVRVTRGQNQLNGDEALINMQTGVSQLMRTPGNRVQGLVVPNDKSLGGGGGPGARPPAPAPRP